MFAREMDGKSHNSSKETIKNAHFSLPTSNNNNFIAPSTMFRRTPTSWPSYPKETIDLPPVDDNAPNETSETNDPESFTIVGEKLSYSNVSETPSIFAPAVDPAVKPTIVPPENPAPQQEDEELSLNAQELSGSVLEDLPSSPGESSTTDPSAACNEPANQQATFDQSVFNLVPPEDEQMPKNGMAQPSQSSPVAEIPQEETLQQQPSEDSRFEGLSVIAESLGGELPKVPIDETPLPSPPRVDPPKKAKKPTKPTDPALLMCCGTAFAVFFLGGSILSMSTIPDPVVLENDIPNMSQQQKTSEPVPKSPEPPAGPPMQSPAEPPMQSPAEPPMQSPAPAPTEGEFKNEKEEKESDEHTFDFDEPDDTVPPADSTDENGFSWISHPLLTLVYGAFALAGGRAFGRSSETGTEKDESFVNVKDEGKGEQRGHELFESRRITRSMAKSLKQERASSASSSSRCDQLRLFLLECRETLHRTGYKKGQATHMKYDISNYDKLTKDDLLKVICHLDCPQTMGNKHTLVVALVDAYAALLNSFKKYEIEGLLKVKGVDMLSKTKKDAMIKALVEAGF